MAHCKLPGTPDGYHSITPYLAIRGAASAIEFYKKVFGAKEVFPPMMGPGGKVGHAELQIGSSKIMLSDEWPGMNLTPDNLGGSPVALMVYVENVDVTLDKALLAGASLLQAAEDKFYGDRSGSVLDPYGHTWHISTQVEVLTPEEMAQRAAKAMSEDDSCLTPA